MRFSFVLAAVAALTVPISAMPSVTDRSISTSEGTENCPVFCLKDIDCFGCTTASCVSSSRPGFHHLTHRRDSMSFFAPVSVYVVSIWSMARRGSLDRVLDHWG